MNTKLRQLRLEIGLILIANFDVTGSFKYCAFA